MFTKPGIWLAAKSVPGGLYPGIFEVIQRHVGRGGLGDDVARSLSASTGAHVIADQNDHAAAFGRGGQEILGGGKDAVVNVRRATRLESFKLRGNFIFIFRERNA